jgi:hypothetical protein
MPYLAAPVLTACCPQFKMLTVNCGGVEAGFGPTAVLEFLVDSQVVNMTIEGQTL